MEDLSFSHKIYKNDPLLFKSYIGKEVNILTEAGNTVSGTVYTVDPVSESVVILQGYQPSRLKIVFGHTIRAIDILNGTERELVELFTNTPTNLLQSNLEERKKTVMCTLKENRFPVREEKDILVIEDVLVINPPYESKDCVSANSVILGRIQKLLCNPDT